MKKINGQYLLVFSLVSLMMIFITTSCSKNDNDEAPELPPQSSFVMDFSDFEENDTKSLATTDTYQNRAHAIIQVSFWNSVIAAHLGVPIAAFNEAFNHTPTPQSDGSWLWSYSVEVNQNTYTANLYGKVVGNEVEWKMYISKSGLFSFNNFLWYTGLSRIDKSQGTWTLYKGPFEPFEFIGIDWYRNDDLTRGITYTNIIPGGAGNGGYISHGITTDITYNAFYNIYHKEQNNLVEINWHRTTKAGQIKNPVYFGNNDFHCWNELGVDIECQ
jgi:hypothetical protein